MRLPSPVRSYPNARINAPRMSHAVGLLYPDNAQLMAALGNRKPGADICCGLNNTNRARTVTRVIPISAIAAPGNGSRTKPAMIPTKMAKKYHACWGNPDGAGISASTTATPTGASDFHAGVDGFGVGGLAIVASV